MTLKKTVVSEGEELPVHRENILDTRVVREESSLEIGDLDPKTALEVWYIDTSRSDSQMRD